MMKRIVYYGTIVLCCTAFFLWYGISGAVVNNAELSSQFQNKIWVVSGWDGGAYEYTFSICITDIEDGKINGIIRIGDVALPDCYRYRMESSISQGIFSGEISGKYASCDFYTNEGDVGNLDIVFLENSGEIDASIVFTKRAETHMKYGESTYRLRPYNLSDSQGFLLNSDMTLICQLPRWGQVQLIAGKFDTGKTVRPEVYLTDTEDNILYHFGNFLNGLEVVDIQIEDYNNDGLDDVFVLLQLELDQSVIIERLFYQMDGGTFYDANLYQG